MFSIWEKVFFSKWVEICRILATFPAWGGWVIFSTIFIGVFLVLIEAHKLFYDEDGEQNRIAEAQRETERDHFMAHLNGTPRGGDA